MTDAPLTLRPVELPIWIDLVAVLFFSVTGAMEGIRRHYDFVGVFVLAIASGLGGGLLRDGFFIQSGPPAAMRETGYMLAVVGGCVVAILFYRQVGRLSKPFLIFDALGTGAYGVVGASKAFAAGLAVPACLFVGVVNAVGSGLIRDVLVREEPLLLKPGQFYVIAALLGVGGFALLTLVFHVPAIPATLSAIAITLVIRMLAVSFDWKTTSILHPPSGD